MVGIPKAERPTPHCTVTSGCPFAVTTVTHEVSVCGQCPCPCSPRSSGPDGLYKAGHELTGLLELSGQVLQESRVPRPVWPSSPPSAPPGQLAGGTRRHRQRGWEPGSCREEHWVADGKRVGGLLIGQLLHMQGHRPCLIALLVVLGDIHVPFRVPCVIGHPHSDGSTRNGYLEDTRDGSGREREGERCWIWGLALAGTAGLSRGLGSSCMRVVACRGPSDVFPWALSCTPHRVWREGPSHLPASSASSWPPPRSALPVPGPALPCCSSQHAPPLPLRGGGPGLGLPHRAAGGCHPGVGGGRQ